MLVQLNVLNCPVKLIDSSTQSMQFQHVPKSHCYANPPESDTGTFAQK